MSENHDQTHPKVYLANTLKDLRAAKEYHLKSADEIDHSITILEAGQPYWEHVDPSPFYTTASGVATIKFLDVMAGEAHGLCTTGEDAYRLSQIMTTTSGSYGTVTNTAATVLFKVDAYDPSLIAKAIDKPQYDAMYISKYKAFDPELARLYNQILQVRRRTSSHPEKSILSDIRQVYDHLMRILAPDDQVRAQPGWKPFDPDKPKMVTRAERLEFAAQKHIKDETLRATMLASTGHILAVHEDLNELFHTEKPLDVEEAYSVSEAMIEVLNQWADVLDL